MCKKGLLFLLLSLALIWSCQKCPTQDQLTGSWLEIKDGSDKSKLIFEGGDHLYFFHATTIDTLTYTLDRKHSTLFLVSPKIPNAITVSCQIEYHKRKKILTISGLLPAVNGNVTITNYKRN
jgi:hypothetical protein